mgnify:FL=1
MSADPSTPCKPMRHPRLRRSVLLCGALLLAPTAQATLLVQVAKAVSSSDPVAVPRFGPAPAGQPTIAQIVREDLRYSGYFRLIPPGLYPADPHRPQDLQAAPWAHTGALTLALGSVRSSGQHYRVQAYVVNLLDDRVIAARRFDGDAASYHQMGQDVANLVYRAVTGHPGPFRGHIAYVDAQDGQFRLQVAASDGWNPRTVLRGRIPVISPAWSPRHGHLAYVSYRHQHSVIYIQNLRTGRRHEVSGQGAALSAPAYSPNGRYLAFARVWAHGRTEIVRLDLANGRERVLTREGTVNTSPVWTPSGRHILFVSNRDGSAQIFQMDRGGGQVQRLSFAGGYNVSPAISPNGRWISFIHADGGVLSLAVMDRQGRDLRVLYDGANCERPSFAPDGRLLLFNTHHGGRKVLAEIAINGKGLHFLNLPGQANEGSWDFL